MTDIKSFLTSYQGKKIKYVPNPGNAGDSFIGYATLQVFKELNLDYQICKSTDTHEGDIIFYGGGGSLIRKYKSCKNFLINNHEKNNIIVLPNTINECDDLLKSFSDNVILFAREDVSFNYIKSKMRHTSNALLSRDMSFYIKGLNKYKNVSSIGTCNVYRFDDELKTKNNHVIVPDDNKDISVDFSRPFFMKNWYIADDINTQVEKNLSIATDNMFSYISKFKQINTNRLHVGIAAALLGKTVNLYPGSYFKIEAIYNCCMRNKFNNVTYHGH